MAGKRKIPGRIIDEICEHLANGVPLRAICRMEGMPSHTAVYKLAEADEAIRLRIADARARGFEALAEQCIDIADDERHDWLLSKKGVISNEVAVGRAKLRVWTRLQLLAKWDPKRYGEKVVQEHTGPGGGPVQQVTMTPDEFRAIAKGIADEV